MKLTYEELQIVDIALQLEIKEQEKFLERIISDDGLEDYLKSTKQLHEKVNRHLMKEKGSAKMENLTPELYDEVLRMGKLTGNTEISLSLLREMNNTLSAGTRVETVIGRLRKMGIEAQDSLSGRKVSDM